MLLLLHTIIFLINKLRKTWFPSDTHSQLEKCEECEIEICSSKDEMQILSFDPPVYKQRYGMVYEMFLKDKKIKKVVDFGCAEMGLFYFLRQLYSLQEVLEVDVDATLLSDYIFKVNPVADDFINKRTSSFTVHVLAGSISDPSPRLIGTDAVIAIEIIEHLFPDTLDALPYNIFNYIKPRIVVFTTPNSDFNVLFPNFTGIRHYDHKFEWTREQFQSWGKNLAIRFPNYSVTFEGIGKGPNGTQHLGCCSQMALFTKKSNIESDTPEESFGVCTYLSYTTKFIESMKFPLNLEEDSEVISEGNYKLIRTVQYPVSLDNRTSEQKILDEFINKINLSTSYHGVRYKKAEDLFEIPLIDLFLNQRYSCTFNEALKILRGAGYTIEERLVCNELIACVIADVKSCCSSRSTTPSLPDEESENQISFDESFLHNHESDWGNRPAALVESSAEEWNCIDDINSWIS